MAHAIVVTLVRLVVTQRRLLEWETAAASARARAPARRGGARSSWRDGGEPGRSRWRRSSCVALVARPARWSRPCRCSRCGRRRRSSRYALSRPVPRSAALSSAPRIARSCASVARKTWRYFETFIGAEDHGLPARQRPGGARAAASPTAPRPTNIGMGLLATLAAHDLGFIDTDDARRRGSTPTLTTMEGLERFEGHLLNWYDTQTPGAAARRATSRRSTAATSPAR